MNTTAETQCLAVRRWYLLGVTGRREMKVNASLLDQGYQTYLPLDSEGPLFPGYLFCCLGDEDTTSLSKSPSVHMIHFGTQPATVSDQIVEGLKATEWIREDPIGKEVHLNQEAGPYAHMKAIYKAKKGDRIIVLLKIMGQMTEKEVPSKAIEAA